MRQIAKKFMISAAFLGVFLAFWVFEAGRTAIAAERILSITPAGTEILYDLGLGNRVIGVTKYCNWPPEARTKPSLGNMMHVNLEVVMGMTPDLVVVSDMNAQVGRQIEALGYPVVTVYQDNFEQICDSMLRVGQACDVEETAKARIAELREWVRHKTVAPGETPPRVLVVVGRPPEEDVRKIYVAGRGAFYNDLITRAGGVNAITQDVAYAQMSREGLLRIDPDIIIELIGESGMEVPAKISQWEAVPGLRAAQNNRVSVIKGDFTLRAGPRYPLILDAFIQVIRDGAQGDRVCSTQRALTGSPQNPRNDP